MSSANVAAANMAATTATVGGQGKIRKKHMENETRAQICVFLSHMVERDGKFRKGAIKITAEKFKVKRAAIRRLWHKHKDAILNPDKEQLVLGRKKGSGRKYKWTHDQIRAAVNAVPTRYRHSLRTLSAKIEIPHSTLHRFFKKERMLLTKEADSAGKEEGGGSKTTGMQDKNNTAQLQGQRELEINNIKRNATNKARQELDKFHEARKMRLVEEAVQEVKEEAQQENELEMEEFQSGFLQQFNSGKERVLQELKKEMHRHQQEIARLNAELDKVCGVIGNDQETEESARYRVQTTGWWR